VAQKFGTILLYALTLSNINQFTKLFHWQNQKKICNNAITKNSTTSQVCHYTAAHLRCGGIFSDDNIANFLLILTVKKFQISANIG